MWNGNEGEFDWSRGIFICFSKERSRRACVRPWPLSLYNMMLSSSIYDVVLKYIWSCPVFSLVPLHALRMFAFIRAQRGVCHSVLLSRGSGKDASEDGRCRNRFEIRYPCIPWATGCTAHLEVTFMPSIFATMFAFLAEKKGVCTGAQRCVAAQRGGCGLSLFFFFPSSLFLLLSLFASFFSCWYTNWRGWGGGHDFFHPYD